MHLDLNFFDVETIEEKDMVWTKLKGKFSLFEILKNID